MGAIFNTYSLYNSFDFAGLRLLLLFTFSSYNFNITRPKGRCTLQEGFGYNKKLKE